MAHSATASACFVPKIYDLSYSYGHLALVRRAKQGYARSSGHPPMSRRNQFALPQTRPAVMRVLLIGVLACTASASILPAQTSAAFTIQSEAKAVPAVPEHAFTPRTFAPGQDQSLFQSQPPEFGRETLNAGEWSRSILNPFQPPPTFTGTSTNKVRFSGAGFAAGRQLSGEFNSPSSLSIGSGQRAFAPLFPEAATSSSFGTAPLAPPSLNQILRARFMLPLSSSTGSLSLFSQDRIRPGTSLGDFTRPYGSAIFSTSDLGNGVFLSAGTGYGHSNAGAPAAGLGSSTSAEPKHSGPTVALKLSF